MNYSHIQRVYVKFLYYDTLMSCAQRNKGNVTDPVDLITMPLPAKYSNTSNI